MKQGFFPASRTDRFSTRRMKITVSDFLALERIRPEGPVSGTGNDKQLDWPAQVVDCLGVIFRVED